MPSPLEVVIRQIQPGRPYHLDAKIMVVGRADERLGHSVTVVEAETVVDLHCPFEAVQIVFDPDHRLLAEIVGYP